MSELADTRPPPPESERDDEFRGRDSASRDGDWLRLSALAAEPSAPSFGAHAPSVHLSSTSGESHPADDLRRFRDGEPIAVRPPGRWSLRAPRQLMFAAILAVACSAVAWKAGAKWAGGSRPTDQIQDAYREVQVRHAVARLAPDGEIGPWTEATVAARRAVDLLAGDNLPPWAFQVRHLAEQIGREEVAAQGRADDLVSAAQARTRESRRCSLPCSRLSISG